MFAGSQAGWHNADMDDSIFTVEQEIGDVSAEKPHVVLIGAGASKAALPHGDKHGRPVPLLRDVAEGLSLVDLFPDDLKALAAADFEAAYSRFFARRAGSEINQIDAKVREYFAELELPDKPTLYDSLVLSLRNKDVIATFNWDPFLIQSLVRLNRLGILPSELPQLRFLHGNVAVGACERDPMVRGFPLQTCARCGNLLRSPRLLYPVEQKDYQSDAFIRGEWDAVRYFLRGCAMFIVFGYSAPVTDKEAVDLLMQGWGTTDERNLEQTEAINRPGADHEALRQTWAPFIHSHHYEIHDGFYSSFLARHPRRSIEACWNQYFEVKFVSDHPVPEGFATFEEMTDWFGPLLEAERARAHANAR